MSAVRIENALQSDRLLIRFPGTYIGLYALLLAGSNYLAPVFAGFINQGQGWQWVLYWCAIFNGIGLVICFFFMEETNYSREPIAGIVPEQEQSESPTPPETTTEKAASGNDQEAESDLESRDNVPARSYKRKTYFDKIKLFQAADLHKPNHIGGMMLRPLIFMTFPVIFYAGFSYGSNLIWFNVLNGTASLILGTTYGFASSMVGLSYLSPLIGVILGSIYTGPIGDRIVLKIARRNGGILEPEHRLWLFLPSLILVPFGLILWGVGAAHHVQWFGCIFAMAVIALTNTFGIQLSVSYAIDSYRALSGEAMITVIIIRNTMSFAVNYGLTPWVDDMGLQNAFIVAAFVGMAQVCTIFFFTTWGKQMRKASAGRYAKYVAQMADSGLVH